MDSTQVKNKLGAFKDQLIRLKTLQQDKQERLNEKIAECDEIESRVKVLGPVKELVEQSNIVSREFIRNEVEKLVTQGLQFIFDDPTIKFTIDFVSKRNQIEAEFSLSRDSEQVTGELLFTHGGGIADIISTALRVVVMQLLKIEGPLILDEPGKFISAQYIANFGGFLTKISETFGRQLILVTHNETLAQFASATIKVEQVDKVSKVTIE